MNKLKTLIKKNFSSFAFFYHYLRYKIVLALLITMGISILDGLGLSMFFPLLQVVGGDEGGIKSSSMGKLHFLVDGIRNMGIELTIGSVLTIMFFFFLMKGVATYFSQIYMVILKQEFIRRMRLDLLEKLNKMSYKRFINSNAGQIQNTMSGEVDRLTNSYTFYSSAFQNGVMVLVYMAFAFFMDSQFALLVTIGGALTNILYRVIYKRTKGYSRKFTGYTNLFQGQIIQHVGNFKYLKATGMVDKYGKRLVDTIFKMEIARKKMGFLSSIAMAAREPLLVAIIASVIYIQFKYFGGQMGAILITLLFFYRALTYLVGMQQYWNGFVSTIGSIENMKDFQKELDDSFEADGKVEFDAFKDKIALQNVHFSYGDTAILKDINLDICKNQSIAFVGESGSGKTTLVNLIAGLLPETSGDIYVDDVLLKEMRKQTYQSRIGYVSQDPVIFNDTIYNNVSFWTPKSENNINRVSNSIAQASLTTFIQDLPKGLETELGNSGINLSGGQKQRMSIARELFKSVDLLILDEATSALDSETENEIQKSIDALQGQYTLLIVAHRLSTIRNVDQIVFMGKGKIIDKGTFLELIERQSRFRAMAELQEL